MEYTQETIHEIVSKQRSFFRTNQTLSIKWRKEQLKKLKNGIIKHQDKLIQALYEDLGRSEFEAYMLDIGDTIMEINECIHGIKRWSRAENHFSGLMCFPSLKTKVYKVPYGVSLIISPFNFPVFLSLGVLAAAICAGNTAIIKASSKSKASTQALKEMLADTFDENYITLIDGGHDVADYCLNERFDKIFYTGSPNVGKHVMEMAAKNLTPVTLELGGETGNWAIIRKDANLKDAARKIAFFKICNSGQICININQVAVAKEVSNEFVKLLKEEIIRQIGQNPLENEEYPKLINKQAFEKCQSEAMKYQERIVFGGNGNEATNQFEPTLIFPVGIDEPIVNHELFNPLLPIVEYRDDEIDKLLEVIASREHGLAFYVFTSNKKWAKKVMQSQQYGGGCINEVCIHLMVKGVPFNGTGHSGMGAYHGVWGFREFSHPATVLFGKTHFNLSLREHPYNSQSKRKIIKMMMK